MAYVNVKDWSVEQVTDWLKGLDNVVQQYTKSFLNNFVNGHKLLSLRADDLEHLGVHPLGHQEIILESVEHLRNFHYELDKENLQMLALRLSCTAGSLSGELRYAQEDAKWVHTQCLSDVHNVIATLKPLVCWLDRSPFHGDKEYTDPKKILLQLGLEMATNAHRDTFSDKPIVSIRDICDKLSKLADKIIQMSDPMILQPATLDLTTLKKREQELGFYMRPSNAPVHQIEFVGGPPAQNISSKIELGDEIVQVNYQTVVGWQGKKVMLLLQESPPEIVLTLKKRPRHTKVYGQIYMKPYRLPSRKRAGPYSRWNENLPSPRLLTIHDLPQISLPKAPSSDEIAEIDTESSSGSDSEPPDSPLDNGGRFYPLKPRSVLQRRNTITGAMHTNSRDTKALEQYYRKLLKKRPTSTHSSSYNLPADQYEEDGGAAFVRDKSASCGHGLELSQMPAAVSIGGLTHRKNSFKIAFADAECERPKRVNFDDTRIIIGDAQSSLNCHRVEERKSLSSTSLSSLKDEAIRFIDEAEDLQDRSKMVLIGEEDEDLQENLSVKCIKECLEDKLQQKQAPAVKKDTVLEDVRVDNIIRKFDEWEKPKVLPRKIQPKPAVVPRNANIAKHRGKLDKSHSTPAYDLTSEEIEIPKANVEETETKENVSPIKYELGIPIVANDSQPPLPAIEPRAKPNPITTRVKSEVPPKPPPRTHIPAKPQKTITPEVKVFEERNQQEMEKPVEVNFEPVSMSTPVSKPKDEVFKIETHPKVTATVSAEKAQQRTSPSSSSNPVVRVLYSSKNKSGKKKNSLIARKRKVSVNDVSPGEMSGYLYQRFRSKHNQNVHWERRWFVLNQNCLYGFKTRESGKAECYIHLAGFTVTLATEVKSRANAFKVYHTGTVFYFSAENDETLSSWLEMMTAATFNTNPNNSTDQIVYSETDDDDDDSDAGNASTLEKPPSDGIRKFNSLKKFTCKKRSDSNSSVSGSTSLDRKWFFNKSNTPKSVLPVPTAQFRSYRKIQTSTTIGNFTSHIPNFASRSEKMPPQSGSSVSNLSAEVEHVKPPKMLNHLHSSNPSLCGNSGVEYNSFPVYPPPQMSKNTQGFVTLKELMNSERDAEIDDGDDLLPPINPSLIRPDVVYGEIPIRPTRDGKKTHARTASDSCSETKKESSCFGKRSSSVKSGNHSFSISKNKTNNSLPRTNKSDVSLLKQKSNSSKSLLCTKEQSYEMIYCPQTTIGNDVQFAQNRALDGRTPYHHHHHEDTPKRKNYILKSGFSEEDRSNYNSRVAFELNLDEKPTNKSGKFKQFFSKQDGGKKEKKTAGGRGLLKSATIGGGTECGITWPSHMMDSYSMSNFQTSTSDISSFESQLKNSPPAADYPGLEYPPVFEPETYSLANPQGTLLRKQTKKN